MRKNLKCQFIRRQSGFTLIELSIVIALMVILYALATPSLRNLAPSSRLKSTARGIRSLLTYARDTAMTEGAPYLVVFDLDNQQYWLASSENFDIDDPTTSLATEESFYTNSQQSASASEEENDEEEAVGLSRTAMILGIPREPSAGIEMSSMNIAHNTGTNDLESEPEEVSEGIEYIYFTPAGTSEDMVLYIQDKRGKTMSVRVKKETGWVSIQKESQSEAD